MPRKLDIAGILALVITIGFFGILALMLNAPNAIYETPLLTALLGGVATAWTMVVTFYFGSSSGSSAKNDLIAKLTAGAEPAKP